MCSPASTSVAEDLTSNGEPSKTGPSLAPYFLILFGASAGLGSIIVLLAELRRALGLTDTGIALAIPAGPAAPLVAHITPAPPPDRRRTTSIPPPTTTSRWVAPSTIVGRST